NVWQPEGVGDQQANVVRVWGVEPAQLPAHGGVECGPQPKGRGWWTKQIQRFANEFLDVRFPGRYARPHDCSVHGRSENTPASPNRKTLGDSVQAASIVQEGEEMPRESVG